MGTDNKAHSNQIASAVTIWILTRTMHAIPFCQEAPAFIESLCKHPDVASLVIPLFAIG